MKAQVPHTLDKDVTIGVQRPDQVDVDALKATLPVGTDTVTARKGGLDVADGDDVTVIASAARVAVVEVAPLQRDPLDPAAIAIAGIYTDRIVALPDLR